jgi:hypothetical protein
MAKMILRSKSVGTKVSDDEYVQIKAQAAAQELTLSEWCREVLLATVKSGQRVPGSSDVLAEVQALRAIVLNLFYASLRGEAITEQRMQQIVQWADEHKRGVGTLEKTGEEQ